MINKLDIYFFVPAGVPANVGLLWDIADQYDLEFVESGGCYSISLAMNCQEFEYETTVDSVAINSLSKLLTLDEDRRIRMRQNWRHRSSGIQFSTTIAPVDVGGYVVHLTTDRAITDNDFENFMGSKHKQLEFWKDLLAGYYASFYASAHLYRGGFRELFEQYPYPVGPVDEGWVKRGKAAS